MMSMTLPSTNSASSHVKRDWMKQSVQQFFMAVNWENQPSEIQELKQSTFNQHQTLSLTLKVSQFLNAIPWEGRMIATMPQPEGSTPVKSGTNAFTLEDFSGLF